MNGVIPFTLPVRVYWEDTDAGGVVFHANYLRWFERARSEWLRCSGVGQDQLRTDYGVLFVVTDVTMRLRRAARLDDLLNVSVRVAERRAASLQVEQQVMLGDNPLVDARIRLGCVSAGTFRPQRIPSRLFDLASTMAAPALFA